MKRFSFILGLGLALLLQASAVLSSDPQHTLAADGKPRGPEVSDVSIEHAEPRQLGADQVDAALAELRKIPRSPRHSTRRPLGFFSNVLRIVLYALPPTNPAEIFGEKPPPEDRHLSAAVRLLEQSAAQNNSDALYILAELNFHGNYSHPRNLAVAFERYQQLATVHGNSTAQFMLGVFYGTGIGGVVERDQARALLYYTFAAAKGDSRAEMAVAFRHHSGIGTPKSCERATRYYKRVADKAMGWYRAGPLLGRSWTPQARYIADDNGGVYGHGASASSAGINALKAGVHSEAYAAVDDVIEYLDLLSQKGDSHASLNLGRIYYEGQRDLEPDMRQAFRYFTMVARRYWKTNGRPLESAKTGAQTAASRAAGYLGRMHLRGEGAKQNFQQARSWFELGAPLGDAQSQHGYGFMKLHGLGGPQDTEEGTKWIQLAAQLDHAPAQVDLGVLHLGLGTPEDIRHANSHFELAARWGNIEAVYYLAEMAHHGVGRDKMCTTALNHYKHVAEKVDPLLSSWADANQAYEDGDHEAALLGYLLAAEQGYEKAQANVAHLLDSVPRPVNFLSRLLDSRPSADRSSRSSNVLDNPELALVFWTRSSRQYNTDATVKMGDYYYHGIGADQDLNKAALCYTGASDYARSAQALWNLGWMHETGIGLNQDYHLAKRYYDQALEVNEEAYLPVTLSLAKLRLKSAWNTFTHGPIHSIQDEPKPKRDWSLSEWIDKFLEEDDEGEDHEMYDDIYDDDSSAGAPEEDGDEEGVFESMGIMAIAMMLLGLLWYRQQRQQARQREEEARRGQQEAAGEHHVDGDAGANNDDQTNDNNDDGDVNNINNNNNHLEVDNGVFPPMNDPEAMNWLAGGVGH